jgi:hypothetical protein
MSELMEDVTTSQLAAAIQAASEEVPWLPEHGPAGEEYYRQVALRTQGHLRKHGVIGRVDRPTRNRVLAALERVKEDMACTGAAT